LWLTFRTYGAERIQQAIQRGIHLAEYAERRLRSDGAIWDVVTPAQLGIVTFALHGAETSDHERAASALSDSGLAAVSTTTLKGRSALRLCILNPLTQEKDIDDTIAFLARAGSRSR
jgi:glutamate/tyrosine decarboxylase-like PLP-dependent enzyme